MSYAVSILIQESVTPYSSHHARCMIHQHSDCNLLISFICQSEFRNIICNRGIKFNLSFIHKLHHRRCCIYFTYRTHAVDIIFIFFTRYFLLTVTLCGVRYFRFCFFCGVNCFKSCFRFRFKPCRKTSRISSTGSKHPC